MGTFFWIKLFPYRHKKLTLVSISGRKRGVWEFCVVSKGPLEEDLQESEGRGEIKTHRKIQSHRTVPVNPDRPITFYKKKVSVYTVLVHPECRMDTADENTRGSNDEGWGLLISLNPTPIRQKQKASNTVGTSNILTKSEFVEIRGTTSKTEPDSISTATVQTTGVFMAQKHRAGFWSVWVSHRRNGTES